MRIITSFFIFLALLQLGLVTYGTNSFFKLLERRQNDVRMLQVRLLPEDIRDAAIRLYARKLPAKSDVLIIGDSQLYGNSLPPSQSLGAYLRDMGISSTFNMSIIDGRNGDLINVLTILRQENKTFKYLVTNINPSHFKPGLEKPLHLKQVFHVSPVLSLITTNSPHVYAPFYAIPYIEIPIVNNELDHIHSIDLWDDGAQARKQFAEQAVTQTYYRNLTLEPALSARLKLLKQATKLADHVIALASPTSYEIYNTEKYGWNWDTEPLISDAIKSCRQLARVSCVNLSNAIPHEEFTDVIHLGPEGQKRLAGLIKAEIEKLQ